MTASSSPAKYKNVLVIDDSQMDILLMKMILESINYAENINFFEQAEEAFKYLDSLDTKNKDSIPDIIFLDINMPEISGFEFLEKFKILPQEIVKHTKFMIVSSSEDLSDVERTRKYSNVEKYLVKPINKRELI
ncbi:MAG: two-component system response regulator [Cytophagaceae bacterium]